MSRFRRIEIAEASPSFWVKEASIFAPKPLALTPCFPSLVDDELDFALDLLCPNPRPALIDFPSPFDNFDAVADLIEIGRSPFFTSTKRLQRRFDRFRAADCYLQSLSDRVSALELSFDRLVNPKACPGGDRKYTWTAEIDGQDRYGFDRKYKWTAEMKGERKVEKSYKLTAEIKSKDEDAPFSRTYTFKSTSGVAGERGKWEKKEEKEEKKKEKKEEKMEEKKKEEKKGAIRLVEIEEPFNHGAVVLRHVCICVFFTDLFTFGIKFRVLDYLFLTYLN